MDFTSNDKGYLIWQVFKRNEDLGEILLDEYPDIDIFIVRGHDIFEDSKYIYQACFTKEEAIVKKVIAESFPNGDSEGISDRFYILKGTFRDLENRKIVDPETGIPLDDVDKDRILSCLSENLE